jgi:hypothetical protein
MQFDPFNTVKPVVIQYVAGPLAILSGILATWLTTHVHFLATFHIDQAGVAGTLTQLGIFSVSALVTYFAQHNWVKGHQVELAKAWDAWIDAGHNVPNRGAGVPPTITSESKAMADE